MTTNRFCPLHKQLIAFVSLGLLFIFVPQRSQAFQDTGNDIQVTTSDGFVLDGKVQTSAALTDISPKRVIILLHGSGPQSMDSDLTSVTKGQKKNLFFAEIGESLSKEGFVVIRYNKRSYQLNVAARADRSIIDSDGYKSFLADPLRYFVSDAVDVVTFAEAQFPDAEIYLLGHSQGTFVALQVADQLPQIKGVALIGYYASSTETILFEQTIYRPLPLFEALDLNDDDVIDGPELAVDDPVASSLTAQMAIIDLDSNGKLEKMEFQAGNLSNLIARDFLGGLRTGESSFPRTPDILATASFKVAFFQGLLDNQTPAYNTKAIELVARNVWKNDSISFSYFPGLGHGLDARLNYDDLQYDTIDPAAKAKLASELALLF